MILTMPLTDAQLDQLAFDFLIDVKRELTKFYPLLINRAFGDASGVVGVNVAFDLSNPKVQEVLDDLLGAESLQGVGDSLIDLARGLIGQAADEGWSNEELALQLRARGVTDSKSRSMTIARTETATAYSKGAILAFRESGVVKEIEWLVAPDCCEDICGPLDGKRVALGESFGDVDHPPAHPNCRCAILPVVS